MRIGHVLTRGEHCLCEPVRPTRVPVRARIVEVHPVRVADDDLTVRATLRGALRRETRERRRETLRREHLAEIEVRDAVVLVGNRAEPVVQQLRGRRPRFRLDRTAGRRAPPARPSRPRAPRSPSRPPRTGRRVVHRPAPRRTRRLLPGEDEHERRPVMVAQRLLDLAAQVAERGPGHSGHRDGDARVVGRGLEVALRAVRERVTVDHDRLRGVVVARHAATMRPPASSTSGTHRDHPRRFMPGRPCPSRASTSTPPASGRDGSARLRAPAPWPSVGRPRRTASANPARTPRSPTGHTSRRPSWNMRNISAVHSPMPCRF